MSRLNRNIAFIGGGHITSILIENLLHTKTMSPERLFVSDPDKERLKNLKMKFGFLLKEVKLLNMMVFKVLRDTI